MRDYSPYVLYEYKIGERLYTAERIGYTSSNGPDIARAQAVIDRYPVGAIVSVHYDPQNPSEAVLELSNSNQNYVIAAICIVAAIIFPFLFLWEWRRRKSKSTNPSQSLL